MRSPSSNPILRSARALARPRSFAVVGLLGVLGACHDFQTARATPPRGTIGEEIFGAFCDRLAGQALREDLSGASFRNVCHKDGGQYADTVDESVLPPAVDGALNRDGQPVSVEKQNEARAKGKGRIHALARRRADLIEALDAVFPDADVQVLDTSNPEPKATCAPGQGNNALNSLGNEVADMLSRMTDLYNDDTLPASTRSLARVLDFFRRNPEAQGTVARFAGRDGYRPPEIDIGVVRPAVAYPRFRDLASETLRLLSFDSDPYAADPPRNPDGSRKRVPGAAYGSFSKMLEVAHEELRTTKAETRGPLSKARDGALGFDRISRPRENLEFLTELFFVEDGTFGGGPPKYIAKRDRRGFVALGGALAAPFVDKDKDGLPDVDNLGRFVTVDGNAAPPPFVTATAPKSPRDEYGRAVIAGQPVYGYVDTSHNTGAQLLADLRPLVDPNKDVLMSAIGGATVTFGKRKPATRSYPPDVNLVERWKATHDASEPPPADLGTRPVVVDYQSYDPATAPMVDFVHALGQVIGDRGVDDVLAFTRLLLTDHPAELASVAGEMLAIREISQKYDKAALKEKSLFWDEMLDVVAELATDRALLEAVLDALADPATVQLGDVFAKLMGFRDRITYDRNNLNGEPLNKTTGKVEAPKTAVDRGQPDTGDNRSILQKLAYVVADASGVAMCNKDGSIVHAKGVPLAGSIDLPLLGTYKECEVFKVDDLARFYIGSIVGKSQLYFRPKVLREGIVGIGAAKVSTIEESGGIKGFWDPPDAKTFRPKPEMLNRLVFFDVANDSVTIGPNTTTNLFVRDLVGTKIGTLNCQERVIDDPDPGAADAASDGKVRGLRTCAPGESLQERHPDALFPLENTGAYAALAPIIKPFTDRGREDLLIKIFKVLHRHYQSDKGTPPECDGSNPKSPAYCAKSNVSSYEPLLVEALPRGIFRALNDLTVVLQSSAIPHCTKVAGDGTCSTTAPVSGIDVFADAAESLLSPARSKEVGLKDRTGKTTGKRNDGTTNPQVTPIYLVTQALSAIDDAFAEAAKDPSEKDRQVRWRAARSVIVDQFLRVAGTGRNASFTNPLLTRLGPTLIDLLRSQLWAHCPKSFIPPYERCAWARDELATKMSDTLTSPVFSTSMDVLDVIRKDERARRELQGLLMYLTDPASKNEALTSMRAAATDGMQVLQNDEDLVPFYHILAEALAPSVRDPQGNVVETGLADAQTSLLSRLAARARDRDGDPVCSREIDPNQVLTIVLRNIVTPMKSTTGALKRTPLDVLVDVIGDVNRSDPDKTGRLAPGDFAAVAVEVNDFLMNRERGLEQFYRIIKNGTTP